MYPAKSYAAFNSKQPLKPFEIKRRELGPHDVLIEILFCGICHSDIHQVRNEWDNAKYPMVPGHEIAGIVTKIGSRVSKFKVGDHAGVGCMVGSCGKCPDCREGEEQFCDHTVFTYNSYEKDAKTLTFGGYSTRIVVNENFTLKIPKSLPLDRAAPLLCAGITTYSPLKHWKAGRGTKVAVVGLGGLGHMAVKFARAMGSEVSVLSRSTKKKADAKRLGAHQYFATEDGTVFDKKKRYFDLILNTVSAELPWEKYLGLLERDGSMVLLGVPEKDLVTHSFNLIMRRRHLAGSIIGGIRQTQEMLHFCSRHNILCDVETIPIQKVNQAYGRVVKGDVRYRFVIDLESLR